ncbi:MAG: protease pro-enzyme activation domain-containing protein [Oryzomonas sp.]
MTARMGSHSIRFDHYPIKQLFFGIMFIVETLVLAFATSVHASPLRVVDDNDTVILQKNVPSLARPEFDKGEADAAMPMERMILTLRLPPQKSADLENFLTELHDPASPDFHRWLTPEEFKERFGPSTDDIQAVTDWLTSHGFSIDEVAKGGAWINFSGTAASVERAFHTRIHNYYVNGKLHHANSQDPSIPQAFSDLVAGIVTLHDFPRKMMNNGIRIAPPPASVPDFTSGTDHYLAPGDFATIYDVNALYGAGIDGTGQSIAIVGRTHPPSTDWSTFRSTFGLSVNPPQVIVNGNDPGDLGTDEDAEADLDVEWSGAVAKNAAIKFVVSKSTNTTDGVDLSAQYIVSNNLAPVMSTSFGSCEADLGSSENTFYNNLWQQAATQGITSFISSGDAGAAGCNVGGDTSGSGRAVNGLASTPYNVAVGGTQFSEGSGTYWNTSNGTGYASAISYIPEAAWNESALDGGSDLWATGGGVSSLYAKPAWQASPGVPADGKRDIPDVSLSAARHDGYLVEIQGGLYYVGGTSASSPSFAGLMALIVQKTGQRQGNANTRFYQLANAQYSAGGVAVFHDTTSGNNSVPGVTGYSAATGYDLATGLGSVDATALINNWVPDFAVSAAPASLSVDQGTSGTVSIATTIVSGNFNNAVTLSVSGLPAGATATFSPSSIPAPGAGTSVMTITAGASAAVGTFPLTITATGGSTTHTATVNLTIIQVFTITSSVANGTGGTITPAVSTVVSGGSAVLAISPATGYHLSVLTDNGNNVTSNVTGGSYTISNVTAAHTVVATFAVTTFSITASVSSGNGTISPASSTVNYGGNITLTVTPSTGYHLATLTDNGSDVTSSVSSNSYTIANVSANHAIVAAFSQSASPVPALGPWGLMAAAGGLALIIVLKRRYES